MSFFDKIKTIAETITGYNVIVDTSNGANVEIDNISMPAILIQIQQTGTYNTNNSHYRDSSDVRIFLLNDIPQDFNNDDTDTKKETLKAAAVELYHKLRFNFDFKTNSSSLKYDVVYDLFDANLLGVIITDLLTERVGLNLACNTVPQPQSILVIVKDQNGNTLGTYTQNGTYTINIQSMGTPHSFTISGDSQILAASEPTNAMYFLDGFYSVIGGSNPWDILSIVGTMVTFNEDRTGSKFIAIY